MKGFNSSASEEDENRVYRAMLQNEVLKLDPEYSLVEDISGAWEEKFPSCSKYSEVKIKNKISKAPFKVLDAPALKDDFYLNLIDWSTQNILAVGLGSCIYLWNASNSKVTKLYDLGASDTVTSVSWSEKGNLLGVGTNSGDFQIWDPEK